MTENVIWQPNKVSAKDRYRVLGQKGLVVWFTGLSGSGKSTIAVELEKMLNDAKKAVYLLDGDNIRHGINSDLEFTDKDRDENIRRIGEISALFCDAGVITLAAFISPFRKMRRFARGRVGENQFLEVYVSTDFETCCKIQKVCTKRILKILREKIPVMRSRRIRKLFWIPYISHHRSVQKLYIRKF